MKAIINFIFIFSLFIGPYLSIKSIYISHIVIGIFIFYMFITILKYKEIEIYYLKKWYILLPFLGVFWIFATIFWSPSLAVSLTYLAYYLVGVSIIFVIINYFSTIEDLNQIVESIRLVTIVVLLIAIIEAFFNFRLPLTPSIYTAAQSEPTVFWGNPNNFATVLTLILPFILFSKSKTKWLLTTLIFVVIYYASSRLNLIAYIGILILYFLFEDKKILAYAISFLTGIVGLLVLVSNSFRQLIFKIYMDFLEIFKVIVEFVKMDSTDMLDSTGTRQNLIIHGIEGLINSNLFGVAAGASPLLHVEWLGETGAMHNFWLEILVEQGLAFFILFAVWYAYLIIKSFSIYVENREHQIGGHAGAITISLIGFLVGALSPSSTIYLLPMWLVLGMAILTIFCDETK